MWKLCITGSFDMNSPVTHRFPLQKATDVESISMS